MVHLRKAKLNKNDKNARIKTSLISHIKDVYKRQAEEVIRMYGYDHVTDTFLSAAQVTMGGYNEEQMCIRDRYVNG